MRRSTLATTLVLVILLGFSMACRLLSPAGLPTPTPVDTSTPSRVPTGTPTVTPTPTPIPLIQLVTLSSVHFEESGESPNYTITSETPALEGSDDPRVQAFNSLSEGIVNHAVNEFKASLKYTPATPLTSGSFIDVGYQLVSPPGDILSLKFAMMGYGDGAAHPYHYSQTLNFDLEQGQELQLGSLFLPDSDYLQALADYCKAELSTRDIAFESFSTGADPSAENYRNWNITPGGLQITFDEYQVAAYAAGPQVVLIPYAKLASIIDTQGPLGRFTQ